MIHTPRVQRRDKVVVVVVAAAAADHTDADRSPDPASGVFSVVAAGAAKNISVFAPPGLAFVETDVALFDSEIAAASLESRVVADVDASFDLEAAAAAVVVGPAAFVIASFALPSVREKQHVRIPTT